jgi:hypothetical protein
MKVSNKPITLKNNTSSYQTNISSIRNNFSFTNPNQENLSSNNISLSVAGMTDSGPKGITYSFNPQRMNLTESNKENSLLKLNMIKDDVIRSENNTLMIIASVFDKDNLTTSILQPLPISIIKLDDSYASSLPFPSSILEETTANFKNYDALKNSNTSSEVNLIDIIKYLSLLIAILLIGFIVYKRIKNRIIIKEK